MTDIDTIECLRKAKELCAKGWTQGYDNAVLGHAPGCFCVATAIGTANPRGFHRAAHATFEQANGIGVGGVVHWNDMPGRTQEDVLKAFDKAIVLAGAKAS